MMKKLKFNEMLMIPSIIMFIARQNIATSLLLTVSGILNIIDAVHEIRKTVSKG